MTWEPLEAARVAAGSMRGVLRRRRRLGGAQATWTSPANTTPRRLGLFRRLRGCESIGRACRSAHPMPKEWGSNDTDDGAIDPVEDLDHAPNSMRLVSTELPLPRPYFADCGIVRREKAPPVLV